jgi:hypothetical protein
MAQAATKPRLTTFHAVLHVTRKEEWCVEAETLEEARALLASGHGYRCHLGDCVHRDIEHIEK